MKDQIIFKIYGAYNWKEESENGKKFRNAYTPRALKHLIDQVGSRITKLFHENAPKIRYNRLRATAGSFLLDGIRKRIIDSNAIIFDISGFNPNVMLELGIAVQAAHENVNSAKVYIICQGKDFAEAQIPSDLFGYFISLYEIKGEKAVFHDSNSLVMRLVSDIADMTNQSYIEDFTEQPTDN
jgi:hypothetical protein